jgi:glycerophosphoryl diester phosphodiesterase
VFEVDVQIDDRDRVVVSHYFPTGPFGLLQRDNWRLRWHTGAARDPRLAEFAGHVPDDCRLLLDLKERTPARRARLRAALIESSIARERVLVCSPHGADLDELRAAGFGTWRTAGTATELADVLDASGLPDAAVTIRHSLLTGQLLRRLHDRVPAVVAWTVNDPARAGRLRDMGVDGVTTDRASVLRLLSPV